MIKFINIINKVSVRVGHKVSFRRESSHIKG